MNPINPSDAQQVGASNNTNQTTLRADVVSRIMTINNVCEGHVNCMYLDTHQPDGLVTTGIGNLIDPIELALSLPWTDRSTNILAPQDDVRREWSRVKAAQDHKMGTTSYWINTGRLVISDGAINVLCAKQVDKYTTQLLARQPYKTLLTWPDECQIALLLMTWAMGPGFVFPHFERACMIGDWATAAIEARMDDSHNVGLTKRNNAIKDLLLKAASDVVRHGD